MSEKSFKLEVEKGITVVFVPGAGVLRVTNAELCEDTGGLLVYWLTTDGEEDSGYWSHERHEGGIKTWILRASNKRLSEIRIVLNSVKQLKFVEEKQTTLTIADC